MSAAKHPASRWRLWRVVVPTAAAVIFAVAIIVPVTTGVGVVYHTACIDERQIAFYTNYFIPAILVNSPYGGSGWGNATVPASFPGAWNISGSSNVVAVAFGTGALNGESLGAFFTASVSIRLMANATVGGPGVNHACSSVDSVSFEDPTIYSEAGGMMLGPNNSSDAVESHTAAFDQGLPGTSPSLEFDNSYAGATAPSVSTCAGGTQSSPLVVTNTLRIWFPTGASSGPTMVAVEFSFVQTFHYIFPANFGTWEIDNLSAPGGPGGGWAFSYTPCS